MDLKFANLRKQHSYLLCSFLPQNRLCRHTDNSPDCCYMSHYSDMGCCHIRLCLRRKYEKIWYLLKPLLWLEVANIFVYSGKKPCCSLVSFVLQFFSFFFYLEIFVQFKKIKIKHLNMVCVIHKLCEPKTKSEVCKNN